ncbi:11683_t:CDS:2 [Funneliformis geosporum]|uniref:11683_t:CDS:1 n=1 Tax=Funneliformis geosporum TaxID=1117311 RepID=A0A9W4WU50_9GLOM|nr:11683_t:CDS:2 [Funneliformis geosporum]
MSKLCQISFEKCESYILSNKNPEALLVEKHNGENEDNQS